MNWYDHITLRIFFCCSLKSFIKYLSKIS
jgi:hypothetical protein